MEQIILLCGNNFDIGADLDFYNNLTSQFSLSNLGNSNMAQPTAPSTPPVGSYNNGFINTALFSGDHAKENLFYYPVYNEYTKETSLYPYLEVTRNSDIVRYYIEYHTDDAGEIQKMMNEGVNFKVESGFMQRNRFVVGSNLDSYLGFENSYNFIRNHISPAMFVRELNASNIAALDKKDKTYIPSSGQDEVDLYKEYNETLLYSNGGTSTHHKIPLRILLDRFLPNAVLLSSWRILKDDTKASPDVVDEIQKIYSEACLADETASGEKLLVKDVFVVSTNIDKNTNAVDLFDAPLLQENAKNQYIDGESTNFLYNSYEALFDSRIWRSGDQNDSEGSLITTGPPSQNFEGGFEGDLIDDIKLVLTHYSENKKIGISEGVYNKLISDAIKVINPKVENPKSIEIKESDNGQYSIYVTSNNGEYIVNCEKGDETFRKHYGLSSDTNISNKDKIVENNKHKDSSNPYNASKDTQDCFIPFMKVAFTYDDDGYRYTSVIIYNGQEYIGYIVKGKEIEDYSSISNKNTFAYFESRDMQCTTVRHWKVAWTEAGGTRTGKDSSHEKWVVKDAFEGLALEIDNINISVDYTSGDTQSSAKLSMNFNDIADFVGMGNAENALNDIVIDIIGQNKTPTGADIVFPAGKLAEVRYPVNPKIPDYTGLLYHVTDASISNQYTGNYGNGSSTQTGGNTIITDTAFINLKALGFKAGDSSSITLDGSDIASAISRKIKNDTILSMVIYDIYNGTNDFTLDGYKSARNTADFGAFYDKMKDAITINSRSASASGFDYKFAAVFPTERVIIPITQEFWDNSIRFYLVGGAKTWSGIKKFKNDISVIGEFADRNNFMYIIHSNKYCKGIDEYYCSKNVQWRGEMYAPIFAGEDSANTSARETDIQLVLAEWLDASEEGVQAADHYIRDLYSLINYSKGVKAESGDGLAGDGYDIAPIKKDNGSPYINEGSYSYLYIPDEILQFDDTTCEKAFWLDRLVSTDSDRVTADENYLRSQAPTFTWQIVDYSLYEECLDKETGKSHVYPLWMFGDQMSRMLYALAANSSDEEAQKVLTAWGGFASGMHAASDLYCRNQADKIYAVIFPDGKNALIKSKYEGGEVTLYSTESGPTSSGGEITINVSDPSGDSINFGFNETVDVGGTAGTGLYFDDVGVSLKLGDNIYKFTGTAAAVYGYNLYQQTLILKSPEKAEALLKANLEDEKEWAEIRAVAPGIVTKVKGEARGGFSVYIAHADGATTSYLHMKRYPMVQEGQYVGAGTLLGYEGTTGNSGCNHVHMTLTSNGETQNPVHYMYPFFTPFYYEEKALESEYALDSEYMSTARTVFPYGQISGANLPVYNEKFNERYGDYRESAVMDENNMVKIKNYVPYKVFISDATKLYNEDNHGAVEYVDFSKLPVENNTTDLENVKYSGTKLQTNPKYFEPEFIQKVKKNGNKITGADLIQ